MADSHRKTPSFPPALTIALALAIVAFASLFSAVSSYHRPPPRRNLFVPRRRDLDSDSPEQVFFSLSQFIQFKPHFSVSYRKNRTICLTLDDSETTKPSK
ncbi:putative purple acid phosphatase 20 [Cucumis melo var. makuwa]|uniref:Purple acid phosphatase 20 n=1 Tax=Cucumis melo var. makuwa TaxID=1194695 RepID=A0A5A7SKR5_CUCMM|nr:putative purple acid phosphatase 20 [Cucumis melo var. makuwa]TYK07404.1 putative purple acid phosphatase 20 [Cucumis melo var. makuwa]